MGGGLSSNFDALFIEVAKEVELDNGKHTIEVVYNDQPEVTGCSNITRADGSHAGGGPKPSANNLINLPDFTADGKCPDTPTIQNDDVWSQCFIIPKNIKAIKGDNPRKNNPGVKDYNKCKLSFKAVLDCNEDLTDECFPSCKTCDKPNDSNSCSSCIDGSPVVNDDDNDGYGFCRPRAINIKNNKITKANKITNKTDDLASEGFINNDSDNLTTTVILLLALLFYLKCSRDM